MNYPTGQLLQTKLRFRHLQAIFKSSGALTKEEIGSAIKQLKNGKSAGPDSIPTKALKSDVETRAELLFPLFSKIWKDEEFKWSGKRDTSSSSPRKATSVPAPTTEESRCCPS
ncbi:hypothetical protein DPMN_036628 [Dreissena polymorpha]|uniref:Uncharacterized protein n=1 Tax=Dreissena polymorpha TaxID=45954 RepID=A0A9D4MB73_DREPO|nr:hypothetical protein DPMN_036628 [Dreissena polymorpha]